MSVTKEVMGVAQPVAVAPLACRVCEKVLPSPSLSKCPECKEYQGRCPNCGHGVPPEAKRCNGCKAFLEGTPCWSCEAPVPESARCGVCGAAQGRIRRWFPDSQIALALIIALITVLTATVPRIVAAWDYGSETIVRVIGTEKVSQKSKGLEVETTAIRVAVTNHGTGTEALVESATLTFDHALDLAPATLELLNPEDALVAPGRTNIVRWVLSQGLKRRLKRQTRAEILDLLAEKKATITVIVLEKRPLREPESARRVDSVRGDQIHDFFDEHTP